MKKILKAVLALVVILVALVLAHPLWIGPVVRTAVGQLAPAYLGVPAKLDGFSFNGYTGRVTLDGFVLDNPPGYREKFVKIGHLCVDVNPTTLLSDVIVVEEISLDDFYVSLLTDDKKVYNFETVSKTCSKSGATGDAKAEAPAQSAEKAPTAPAEKKADAARKDSPKIIIDLIQIKNALVQWERVSLPLPSFRLTGLGRSSNGVDLEVAWTECEKQFLASLGPLAQGLQAALSGTQGSLDSGLKAAAEVSKSVGDSQKALTDVQKALNDGSQESLDAAAKSVNEAAKSIEGSVKKFRSLFK